LRDAIRKEVTAQMKTMGAATQDDLDALRKRVRNLERAAGHTASGRKRAARKPTKKATTRAASTTSTTPSSGS
jgi:hypothetical protein